MRRLFALVPALLLAAPAAAQHASDAAHAADGAGSAALWFGVFELPFLAICVALAFATARALRGGVFGRGMLLLACGFLVMAVGHLHMQVEHFTGFHLFKALLGEALGGVAWYLALVATWGLSLLGFARILRASRAAVPA